MDTNKQKDLDARRFNLIRRISEIENEELLEKIEMAVIHESEAFSIPANYPFAPSKEKLHSIIEQVLEDDRNGLMMDFDDAEREIMEYIDSLK